ncbi:hypothetical protein EMIT0P176_320038 [Pseudomonas sp. IT-P176]
MVSQDWTVAEGIKSFNELFSQPETNKGLRDKITQALDIYGAEAGIEPARPYERGILSPYFSIYKSNT